MIKRYFTLLVVFTCFIGLNSVYASSDFTNPYVRVNGNNFFDNSVTINSSYDFRFDVGVFYNGSNTQTTNDRIYGRLALCTSSDINSPYSHTDYVNTNISCDGGYVSFIYFDLVYESSGNFTTYFMLTPLNTSSADVKFFGLSFSYTPFDRYNSDDTLIKQNDVILSDLQSLYYKTSEGFTEVTYKLNDTIKELQDLKSLLSQLLNSCRDSKNLLFISEDLSTYLPITKDGLTLSLNQNGTFHLSGTKNVSGWTVFNFHFEELVLEKGITYYSTMVLATYTSSGSWVGNKSGVITPTEDYVIKSGYIQFNQLKEYDQDIMPLVWVGNTAPTFSQWEKPGEQICKSKVDETNDAINVTNEKLDETNNKLQQQQDFMNDDDTSGSSSEAESFFEGFSTDTYGLTSIITAPLELIGNIAGSSCSPLPLQIPFVGGTFNLPCMSSIYKKHFGSFLTIYQTITFGIVAYWVCIRIFALVKDFKNPEHDEIEVMDL